MKEGSTGKDRERYVGERYLVCSVREFDTGDMTINTGGVFLEGTGRFDNLVEAKIVMRCTCSGFPVQYEGYVGGKKAYYRSRHGVWSFEIYDGKLFEGEPIYFKEEDDEEDEIGYEGMKLAEERILDCTLEYINNEAKSISKS